MSRHPAPGAPRSFPHFHPHITLAAISIAPPPPPPPPPIAGSEAAAQTSTQRTPNANSESDPDPTVLLALREAIPLGQRAVHVRFARVLAGDHYFRSIYVAIAPSPELARLRAALSLSLAPQGGGGDGGRPRGTRKPAATAAAVGPDSPPAFPHLSLYYVADEEAHTRARFFQELEREDVVRHSADGLSVSLRCAAAAAGEEDGGRSHEGDCRMLESCTCTQIWIVDREGPVEGWKVLDKILLAK